MASTADNIDDPAVREFVHHPSFRSVASFFLAFVSVLALRCLVLSLFRRLHHVLFGRRRPAPAISTPTEKVQGWLTSTTNLTPAAFPSINSVLRNLTLGLTLCFGLASLAQFGSLLVFSQHDLPACAFLIAWTGIATQTAKLLGLLNLSLDLRRLGTRRWESYLFWSLLGAAFVVMFVSNAVNVGILRGLPNSSSDAICFRERHIGTGAATIAINVVLELYCISRTLYCLVPGFLYPRHKVEALLDVRVARSLSLLALDIATAPQLFVFFGVLADSIPSSLLTVIVLEAFNHQSPFSRTPPTTSIPVTRPGSAYSRSTIEIRKMSSTHSLQRISHPFAARALQDETPESEDWPASAAAAAAPQFPESTLIRNVSGSSHRTINNFLAPPAATSNRRASGVSEADSDVSRSIKNAVLGFAFRRRDSGRGSFATVPPRTAKAELVLLTKSRNPIQSLPMSPITPASQQPHIEITLTENDVHPSDDSLPSRAGPSPSPRVSDITGLDSNSSSRRGTLSISTSTTGTSNSGPSSAGLPVSQNRSLSDRRSSLHLTPTTPAAPPLASSHRASADSSEWKYDTYLVPEHDLRRASYASRETEGHSSAESSFVVGTSTPLSGQHEPLPSGPSTSHHTTQRYSAPLPPADDDLSIVYEASHEDSDSLVPPSRPARPSTLTFGQPLPVLTVDIGNTLSDVIGQAERSAGILTGEEAHEGEEVRGIGEDMFVAGGIGRAIATPVGVPEDVDGQPRNGSHSGSGSGRSENASRDNTFQMSPQGRSQETGFGNYF